mmetsp:Transcript_8827/g.13257  ORF Transcript_8827/g.13257 Transcript_8827/m.13257 type:complete len:220 (+) Transcript_8827:112-771(+)
MKGCTANATRGRVHNVYISIGIGDNALRFVEGRMCAKSITFTHFTHYCADAPDEKYNNIGQTRVFRFNGTDWVQLGEIIDGNEEYSDDGSSVDLSADGTNVVIGAPGRDNDSGRARVFRYNSLKDKRKQVGGDLVGETRNAMGPSVSISGNGKTIAVSAGCSVDYFCDETPANDRIIKVYRIKDGLWQNVGKSIGKTMKMNSPVPFRYLVMEIPLHSTL